MSSFKKCLTRQKHFLIVKSFVNINVNNSFSREEFYQFLINNYCGSGVILFSFLHKNKAFLKLKKNTYVVNNQLIIKKPLIDTCFDNHARKYANKAYN